MTRCEVKDHLGSFAQRRALGQNFLNQLSLQQQRDANIRRPLLKLEDPGPGFTHYDLTPELQQEALEIFNSQSCDHRLRRSYQDILKDLLIEKSTQGSRHK